MGEDTRPNLDELNLEKEEYKMPEAAAVPAAEHPHHAPIRILLLLFLLAVVVGISAYIYYGMMHTPTVITDVSEPQSETSPEVVTERDDGPSPEIIARMEAMQRDTAPTDEEKQQMHTMQTEGTEVTQETLDRMQAMNPGIALPNP